MKDLYIAFQSHRFKFDVIAREGMGSEQPTGYFIEIAEMGIEGDILSNRFLMTLGKKEVELLIDCLQLMLRQNL